MSTVDLGRLADDLIARHPRVTGARLVRLERHRKSGKPVASLRALRGHPADVLARFRVPSSWIGIGVLCGGWGAPMDGIRPSAHPEAQRVTLVVLLGRDGTVESRVRCPDGSIMRDGPGEGAVLDAMRTALGLPLAS